LIPSSLPIRFDGSSYFIGRGRHIQYTASLGTLECCALIFNPSLSLSQVLDAIHFVICLVVSDRPSYPLAFSIHLFDIKLIHFGQGNETSRR
jgi:hypothetical protein